MALILLAAHPVAAAEAPSLDLQGTRVLVCAPYFDLMNIPAVKRLEAAGAEVRPGALAQLNAETAKSYHVILLVAHSPPKPEDGKTIAQTLDRFVQSGGGLLYFRHSYGSEQTDDFLAPFAASMPWELVLDPAHAFRSPIGFNLPYAYTAQVATNHPATEGVTAIWYSAGDRFGFHTSPLQVGPPWTALVTGEKEARSMWVGGLHEEDKTRPGAFPTAPPIIAAREHGAGAIVLIGISPMEVFYGQGLPAYMDVALEKGDGLRPSGLRRLYDNSLRWLAGRARQSAELGQGDLKPVENPWEKPSVHDWSRDVFGGNDLCAAPMRGVIGLHSSLSDGKARPEALIEKARALGLRWVAFTERLEDFSPEKWESLRGVCKAVSGDGFAALPGLDYADNAGARYVVFGDFDWPPERVFSPDRKRIVIPQWWFNIHVAPNGPYDLGHSPLRYWDYSMYDRLAIRTTIAGKLVDEGMAPYRHMHGVMDDPFPMAVEMCYDEAQLEAAAGRMCNFITQDKTDDLTKWFRERSYYGSHRGFVSDGPVVTDWRAMNETRITGGKWWLPGTEQYRVKLAVRSTAPITDIAIYDGPRLFRRFKPEQEKVTLTFDLPHDQQRNLIAEITDANGKRAVTGGLCIRDFLNWRFMCSDRGNSICDAVQVDGAGAYLTGPTAPYQRKMTVFGVVAGYGERHFNILPPEFDGGMRPVGMHVMPSIYSKDIVLAPPNSTLESRMEVPVCSRDGLLQDDSVTGYFPCNANAWENKCAPQDIRDVRIRYRYLDITPRAHDPGVLLLEGSIRFEKAATLDNLMVFSIFHSSQPGEGDHFAIVTPECNVAGMAAGQPYSASGRMVPGSFACVFPSLWGSSGVFALDDGYRVNVAARPGNTHVGVTLADMPRAVKAGDEIRYRLALYRGRSQEGPNTADWERFALTMGLRGKPAYEVKDVKAGTVTGTRLLLELIPGDGGFAGTITQSDLPIRLPVRVAQMNPNWTFAWFDLDRKEWHPSAVDPLIRQGYFTLDTRRGAHHIFAGHPVVADNPDVRIAVLSDARSEVRATLNNVGDQPVTVTVRLNPALGEAPPQQIGLAPGEMKPVTFSLP
jgi:hypothetical protein